MHVWCCMYNRHSRVKPVNYLSSETESSPYLDVPVRKDVPVSVVYLVMAAQSSVHDRSTCGSEEMPLENSGGIPSALRLLCGMLTYFDD